MTETQPADSRQDSNAKLDAKIGLKAVFTLLATLVAAASLVVLILSADGLFANYVLREDNLLYALGVAISGALFIGSSAFAATEGLIYVSLLAERRGRL